MEKSRVVSSNGKEIEISRYVKEAVLLNSQRDQKSEMSSIPDTSSNCRAQECDMTISYWIFPNA